MIYMIEYQGRQDENGKAVGHAPKVLNEYYDFVKDFSETKVLAPECILNEFKADGILLDAHIDMRGKTNLKEKIQGKLNMYKNANKALKYIKKNGNKNDIVWFFNVEYYIMLYFMFKRKIPGKVVLTMFIDGYHAGKNSGLKSKIINGFKQWVFENAQKKFDVIIATGKRFKYKNVKSLYIPDYYYIKEKFDKYKNLEKTDKAVCLGTMGRGKQLYELVDTFNKNGYELLIAGRFYDKELLNDLKKKALSNIEIIDTYLTEEDYLTYLAKAKYVILPYSPDAYAYQTSGVMQEAIFLNTVVVTYNAILDGNMVNGVGFDSWEELNIDKLKDEDKRLKISEEYKALCNEDFNKDNVLEKYKSVMC